MPATGARVELNLGGTWTDITSDVYTRDGIQITRGRQDQGARVDPGACTLTLNNKQGKYSPRNPLSPLYGLIGRNTPVRVSAVGGAPWLDLPASGPARVRATTPDASALDITGDVDVRFDVRPADWNAAGVVELGGKWGAAGQRSWQMIIFGGGVWFFWTADGTTELSNSVPLGGAALMPRMCLRATLDVDNGASGKTVTFYTGPSLAGPWTQLGTPQISAGTSAVFNSTAPLEVGDITVRNYMDEGCRVYAAEVRNGIGGTVVANPDFTAQAVGATAFTDTAGRAWTVTAGGIANRHVRFLGEVSAWPARWDVSGGDVYVPVQAAGIMRRLGQGASPLDSTLRRRIPSDTSVVAYWPLEDGQGSTQAYSPLPGVAPLRTTGLSFASDDSLAGSSALPTVGSSGARITGAVPRSSSTGAWCIEFVYKITAAPAGDANAQFLVFTTTGGLTWRIGVGATTVHLTVTNSDGASVVDDATSPVTGFFGNWGRFYVEAQQSGGTVNWTYAWLTVGTGGGASTGSFTGSVGTITSVNTAISSALSGMAIGHVAVFDMFEPTAFNDADTGFDGDGAVERYVRLCTEEGVPFRVPYGITGTAAMGSQKPAEFLSLLEDAADADVGVLYEARDSIALAYRPRWSLYNQTPVLSLDYAARGEVAPDLQPTEDDTASRNDITISRPNGSSARVTLDTGPLSVQAPPYGVGRYTTSETLNVQTDGQLPDLASWLLHLGTWDEARYPQVTVNLAAGPWLRGDASTVDVGDLITITNPPAWLPPDDIALMAQGYTETLGVHTWEITYNCTPYGPWRIGILDDPVWGRADTNGSVLASAVDADDTVLSVTTTTGPVWTLDPAEYPFDLLLGGEVVTATAPPPALDLVDGTFESGVTGWTPTGGTFVASSSARTGTGAGLLTVSGTPTQAFVRPDSSHYIPVNAGVTYQYEVWVKCSVNGVGVASIDWTDASKSYLSTTSSAAAPLVAGVWTRLVVQGPPVASAAFARPGPTLSGSPATGTQLLVDDSRTVAANPQPVTVTRGVNGISKSHASGEAVNLAHPMIVGL